MEEEMTPVCQHRNTHRKLEILIGIVCDSGISACGSNEFQGSAHMVMPRMPVSPYLHRLQELQSPSPMSLKVPVQVAFQRQRTRPGQCHPRRCRFTHLRSSLVLQANEGHSVLRSVVHERNGRHRQLLSPKIPS
jgi:hypothetical protein